MHAWLLLTGKSFPWVYFFDWIYDECNVREMQMYQVTIIRCACLRGKLQFLEVNELYEYIKSSINNQADGTKAHDDARFYVC